MLPLSLEETSHSTAQSILRRSFRLSNLDFEYTYTQLILLCTVPKRVYQLTSYRKQIKNHWARDDASFVLTQTALLICTGLSFYIALKPNNPGLSVFRVLLHFVLLQFFAVGALVASLALYVAENFLRDPTTNNFHNTRQPIEWLYVWDVFTNAFFPFFVLEYVLGYLCLPVLGGEGVAAVWLGNAFLSAGLIYFGYIFTLGFHTLPFIKRSEVFLYGAGVAAMAVLGAGFFRVNLHLKLITMVIS